MEKDDFYRDLFENAHDGLALVKLDHTIAHINRSMEHLLGWSRKELIGKSDRTVLTPAGIALAQEREQRLRNGEKLSPTVEHEFLRKDGSTIWVEGRVRFLKAQDGTLIGFKGIYHDISERKAAQEALQQSQQRYQTLVHSLDGIVWELDAATFQFTFVSPQAEQLLGYPMEQWLSEPDFWSNHIHPEDREWARRFCRTRVEEQRNHHFDYRMLAADGRVIWLHDQVNVIVKNGQVTTLCGVMTDISERKRAEAERRRWEAQLLQAQKMEALGILAGGVAHGFNNILTAMLGYSELIEDDLPENSTAHRNLQEILQAGQRAKDLIQQLLAFSRPSQGGKRRVRLQSIVEETLSFLHASLPKTVTLQQDLACPTETIFADPAQIQQVVLNLCVNGAQAMGKRPGSLTVELRRIEGENARGHMTSGMSPGPRLRLSVRDTGIGIEPEILPRIFDPFFTTKPVGKGTGLGLAIVHAVVTDHGGTVTVDSQLGYGATFHVSFPLQQTADPRETAILKSIKEAL